MTRLFTYSFLDIALKFSLKLNDVIKLYHFFVRIYNYVDQYNHIIKFNRKFEINYLKNCI